LTTKTLETFSVSAVCKFIVVLRYILYAHCYKKLIKIGLRLFA